MGQTMAIDLAELEARARAAESKTIPGAYWSVLVGGDELLALIGLARYGARIASVCKPDPHPADIEAYRLAPSGAGPLADEWKDKPHRLVYDLCRALEAERGTPPQPSDIIEGIRRDKLGRE